MNVLETTGTEVHLSDRNVLFQTLQCNTHTVAQYHDLRTTSCEIYRLHAWWSTQSRLATLLSSLIARRWVGLQTLDGSDLSIDEIVGA